MDVFVSVNNCSIFEKNGSVPGTDTHSTANNIGEKKTQLAIKNNFDVV